jgi:hypothetical protein
MQEKTMQRGSIRPIAVAAGAVGSAAIGLYLLAARPWHLRWGATDEEVGQNLPGDELMFQPKLVSTRAISIRARPEEVWPWIVQMGEGRGGFYSYAWLENLIGCKMRNADRICPELQHPEVGDTIWLARWWNRRFSFPSYLLVDAIDPGRALVLRSPTVEGKRETFSWAFVLDEQDEQNARLIVRSRSDWEPGLGNALFGRAIGEPAHFMMERRMMLGIKERAEHAACHRRAR